MKKSVIFTLALLVLATFSFGQKAVPQKVKDSFQQQYPNVGQVKWEKEGELWEAEYEVNKLEISVMMDNDGNVMGIERQILIENLPATIQAAIQQKYPKYKVMEAEVMDKADGSGLYEIDLKRGKRWIEIQATQDGVITEMVGSESADEGNSED